MIRTVCKGKENIMKNMFTIGQEKVAVTVNTYNNGSNLYVGLLCLNERGIPEDPYADLTVNLPEYELEPYEAFIDTNNFPDAEQFLEENGLAFHTGTYGGSGYCIYPVYEFDRYKLMDLCPKDVEEYESIIEDEKELY